jgi:hypothetical protein
VSSGYAYRRQLYRLALKLQRERGWVEQQAGESRAYERLRASESRQEAAEHYYNEQIALLEVYAPRAPSMPRILGTCRACGASRCVSLPPFACARRVARARRACAEVACAEE